MNSCNWLRSQTAEIDEEISTPGPPTSGNVLGTAEFVSLRIFAMRPRNSRSRGRVPHHIPCATVDGGRHLHWQIVVTTSCNCCVHGMNYQQLVEATRDVSQKSHCTMILKRYCCMDYVTKSADVLSIIIPTVYLSIYIIFIQITIDTL